MRRRAAPPLASLLASIAIGRVSTFSPALPRLLRAPAASHQAGYPVIQRLWRVGVAGRRAIPASMSSSSVAPPVLGQDLKELFDVYEAPESIEKHRGEPVSAGYSLARTKVHSQGLWHRAVHVWLYQPDGRVVIQRRAQGKDTFPGLWDCSAAGHVTSGDTVLETVLKEVQEELGLAITASDLEPLGTIATSVSDSSPVQGEFTCNEYKSLFLLKFSGDVSELNFDPAEVEAVEARAIIELAAQLRTQSPQDKPRIDGPFVPRPAHYLSVLLPALEAKFP
ncbi:NUDIX hydrolase domain-like protein [Baffinella frigidus]|nr:NUDIX hydrolase domain-like protein [Cryptophyta sp. CCMP2293]